MTHAVKVVKACKTFGNGPPVLNNMDMTVHKGTIYGLLGASGCGKTTMLSSIVGIRKLDSGEVTVFGVRPGTPNSGIPGKTIGYMPQDIALYSSFKISECIQYFGRIYGMTSSEISARTEFLVNFLDLPEANRRVGSLSGGQQRRVSLAVAMVHQPSLLILDEPTVGVDPLIRESIWEYLGDMVSKRGTTVIITTHYIEEARQSNMVGLMRNGRLLTEKPPKTLLEEHNTNLLEDIVLKLCKKDTFGNEASNLADDISRTIAENSFYGVRIRPFKEDTVIETNTGVVGIKYKTRSPDDNTLFWPKKHTLQRRQSISKNFKEDLRGEFEKIGSIVVRNLILIVRNPVLFGALLLLPTVQVIIFNMIVGTSPQNLGLAVLNKEFNSSLDFLDTCKTRENTCFKPGLSCSYLTKFSDSSFNLIPVASEEDGLGAVTSGKAWGYVSVPSNFTEHMKTRALERNFVTNETMDGTELTARMDKSMVLINSFVEAQMYSNYLDFIKDTVSDCDGDPRVAELPMRFNAIYGSVDGKNGYKQHIAPAQIVLIIFLIPMAAAITMILDKRTGTLERSMVAGLKTHHILFGFIISETFLMILELTVCLTVAVLVFQIQILGSVPLVFILNILVGICGLSFGFFIGIITATEVESMFSMCTVYLPILLSSGATWPVNGNVAWARAVSYIMPCTYPIESFQGIANRGWGFTHSHVWPGFAILVAWIAVLCILSATFMRLQK